MGGVGHSSAARRAGEMERIRLFVGLVVVFVFVLAGAEVVRGSRMEDMNVRMAMLRGLRRCILDEVPGAH